MSPFRVGEMILYNDGREGHRDVAAEILETDERGMLVQFEDRFAPTRVSFSDVEWMTHLSRKG